MMDAIEKVLHECGQKPQALMILGPTAGGKSALSLEIARRHDVEIISMDSALVYRGMDIGTQSRRRRKGRYARTI